MNNIKENSSFDNKSEEFVLKPTGTVSFPSKDGTVLEMDFYLSPKVSGESSVIPDGSSKVSDVSSMASGNSPKGAFTILFLHGGGFMVGNKRKPKYQLFFQLLMEQGYHVAALDYRLGMQGRKGIRNIYRAIGMAVEDVYTAVSYLLEGNVPAIDARRLVLCGSSAGAITALQSDYELANAFPRSKQLPADFRFAGVMAFSGAIFSLHGKPAYRLNKPAPTLFFHGTADKIVTYRKISFLRWGFFGTNAIARTFIRSGYSCYVVRYHDAGHEIGGRYVADFDKVIWFLEHEVCNGQFYQRDEWLNDPSVEPNFLIGMDVKSMYDAIGGTTQSDLEL